MKRFYDKRKSIATLAMVALASGTVGVAYNKHNISAPGKVSLEPTPEDIYEDIKNIIIDAEECLCRDVLDKAEEEIGKLPPSPEKVELESLAKEIEGKINNYKVDKIRDIISNLKPGVSIPDAKLEIEDIVNSMYPGGKLEEVYNDLNTKIDEVVTETVGIIRDLLDQASELVEDSDEYSDEAKKIINIVEEIIKLLPDCDEKKQMEEEKECIEKEIEKEEDKEEDKPEKEEDKELGKPEKEEDKELGKPEKEEDKESGKLEEEEDKESEKEELKGPNINIDVDIDTNGDGKADVNIDIDNDKIPDANIDIDGDKKADIFIEENPFEKIKVSDITNKNVKGVRLKYLAPKGSSLFEKIMYYPVEINFNGLVVYDIPKARKVPLRKVLTEKEESKSNYNYIYVESKEKCDDVVVDMYVNEGGFVIKTANENISFSVKEKYILDDIKLQINEIKERGINKFTVEDVKETIRVNRNKKHIPLEIKTAHSIENPYSSISIDPGVYGNLVKNTITVASSYKKIDTILPSSNRTFDSSVFVDTAEIKLGKYLVKSQVNVGHVQIFEGERTVAILSIRMFIILLILIGLILGAVTYISSHRKKENENECEDIE